MPKPRTIFQDQGHALFLMENESVRDDILSVARKYTGLRSFMLISPPPLRQIVLSDALTVFATGRDQPVVAARMFVINDADQRKQAAVRLKRMLEVRYSDVEIIEPDPSLPAGTMYLVVSPSAMPHFGVGFRPCARIMSKLSPAKVTFL